MSLADDILLPHTPKALDLIMKDRLVAIEFWFPGLIKKVRKWMRSKEFKNHWLFVSTGNRWISRAVLTVRAPFDMKQKVYKIARDDYTWKYDADTYDRLLCVSDYLWRESKFYNKYIVVAHPSTTNM